jgi:aminopeptidase
MLVDDRAKQLADFVLSYSVDLKQGDRLVVMSEPVYEPYAKLLLDGAREIGAEVRYETQRQDPLVLRKMIQNQDPDIWAAELARRCELYRWCNALIYIDCESNPDYAKGIPNASDLIAQFDRDVVHPSKDVLYRPGDGVDYAVKWNLVAFPTKERARTAGMSFSEYSDLLYNVTIGVDWKKMAEEMKKTKSALDGTRDLHIIVPGFTDLHFSLEGRGAEISDGTHNMPDGEIAYGPVEDSLNGHIYFQCPTIWAGYGKVSGIYLNFVDGKVVKYWAKQNKRALDSALNIDAGARVAGEFGIGFNPGIAKPTTDILFDEKMDGTIHIALGDSFWSQTLDNGGGHNRSTIHWDFVCDLRRQLGRSDMPGGMVYADGTLVNLSGKWRI